MQILKLLPFALQEFAPLFFRPTAKGVYRLNSSEQLARPFALLAQFGEAESERLVERKPSTVPPDIVGFRRPIARYEFASGRELQRLLQRSDLRAQASFAFAEAPKICRCPIQRLLRDARQIA